MKKLLLAFSIFAFATTVNAQGKPTISLGANVGTGTKTNLSTSYGVDLQADFPVASDLKITASAGYQQFGVKVGSDISFIPVFAGAKVAFGKGLYGHGQLGYSFLTTKVSGSNQNNGEFSFAPSLGYGFGKNLDVSVKYLSVDLLNAVLLRLAYNF